MADITVTDQTFAADVEQSAMPVLVDFWAPWCGPCKAVAPILEELSREYAGKIKIVKLNVDDNQVTSGKFGVMSIPTMMFFKGGKPVKSVVGAQSKEAIKRTIEETISG